MTELVIIIVLIILNGLFSMSETAIIATRKARLQQLADDGDAGAQAALALENDPNRFLSAVQIGITLVGILTGAFGGASIARDISALLQHTFLAPSADAIGFAVVVVLTTYLSLIIGELVPKRLALNSPERIATLIAPPMVFITRITAPITWFLGVSTNTVLRLLGVRTSDDPPVTEDEIKGMIEQGVAAGVFEEAEQDMVEAILQLGEQRVSTLMTPRTDVIWLKVDDPREETIATITNSHHSSYPVCEDDLDHVVGLLDTRELLIQVLKDPSFDLRAVMQPPLFVPETMTSSKLLEIFRASERRIAFVVGEYGELEGLVTMQDILEHIVGDLDVQDEPIERADGSWLLDGMMSIDDLKELLDLDELPGEDDRYSTLGGFIMWHEDRIPSAGDSFAFEALRFEVMDMDGNRVDKVLVTRLPKTDEKPAE